MTSEEDIKKIREMMELLVKQKVSEKVSKLNEDEKSVYDLTGQTEIARTAGFSSGKVSMVWQRLAEKGLLVKEGKGYRKVI